MTPFDYGILAILALTAIMFAVLAYNMRGDQ